MSNGFQEWMGDLDDDKCIEVCLKRREEEMKNDTIQIGAATRL
jgi:hypothetical protein